MKGKKVKVIVAKLGLDIHWRGAFLISQLLKDAGMDVVYIGNKFPEQIVEAAVEEDADIVCLSTLIGNHLTLGPKVVKLLREKGLNNVKVFLGGVMPPDDAVELEKKHGFEKVFLPDTPIEAIIKTLYESVGVKYDKEKKVGEAANA